MPNYRRAFVPGGTFFFTVVTAGRRPILTTPAMRAALRTAIHDTAANRPFTIDAIVLLPDHLHCMWTLPPRDTDFSTRWRIVKTMATRRFLSAGGREARPSASRLARAERGVWQRRSWEHAVRDDEECEALCDYVHFNPVKHGYAACPHEWPYSSFERFVAKGRYDQRWNCCCKGPSSNIAMVDVAAVAGE